MRGVIFLFLLFSLFETSFAQTSVQTTKSTAQLVSSCSLSVQNLSFGIYNPAQDSFGTSQINYRCTRSTIVTVLINGSTFGTPCSNKYCFAGKNGSVGGRILTASGSSDSLLYNLFNSTTYNASTLLQGSNYGTGNSGVLTSDGTNQSMTIYGALSSGQWIKPSSYSDTLTVLFNY